MTITGRVVIALTVVVAIIASYFFLSTFEFNSDLRHRGQELRAELDQAYGSLNRAGKLGIHTDLSEGLISKYIPAGTSFDDAEAILHSAGFRTRILEFENGNPSLSGSRNFNTIFCNNSSWIEVYPQIPRNFSSLVGKTEAAFSTTCH